MDMEQLSRCMKKWNNPGAEQDDSIRLKKKDVWLGEEADIYKCLWTPSMGFHGGSVVKNPPANAGDTEESQFNPWVEKISSRSKWQLRDTQETFDRGLPLK